MLLSLGIATVTEKEGFPKVVFERFCSELQRVEEEMMRHEKANNTALMAIGGPKGKRLRLDDLAGPSGPSGPGFSAAGIGIGNPGPSMVRPRTKRVNLRDLLFLMEQERGLKRSSLLWKAHAS